MYCSAMVLFARQIRGRRLRSWFDGSENELEENPSRSAKLPQRCRTDFAQPPCLPCANSPLATSVFGCCTVACCKPLIRVSQ